MKYLLCGVALMLLLPVISQAKPGEEKVVAKLYTYKCHLLLQDKREVIRDYWRQPKNHNGNLERMLLTEMVAVEKGKRLAITNVIQCVDVSDEFSKATSRELDRATLR